MASLGIKIIAEDVTNRGRIDISVLFKDKNYIMEFKVGSGDALKQIKEKRYYKKYMDEKKDISDFKWEKL